MWCFRTQPFFKLKIKRDRSKCDRLELESIQQRLNDLECLLKNVQIYSTEGFDLSALQKWHRKRSNSCRSDLAGKKKSNLSKNDIECKRKRVNEANAPSNSKDSLTCKKENKSGHKKNDPCPTNTDSCKSNSSCGESGDDCKKHKKDKDKKDKKKKKEEKEMRKIICKETKIEMEEAKCKAKCKAKAQKSRESLICKLDKKSRNKKKKDPCATKSDNSCKSDTSCGKSGDDKKKHKKDKKKKKEEKKKLVCKPDPECEKEEEMIEANDPCYSEENPPCVQVDKSVCKKKDDPCATNADNSCKSESSCGESVVEDCCKTKKELKAEREREKKKNKKRCEAEKKALAEKKKEAKRLKKAEKKLECERRREEKELLKAEKRQEEFHLVKVDFALTDFDASINSKLVPYKSNSIVCQQSVDCTKHDKIIQIPSTQAFLNDVSSQVDSKSIVRSTECINESESETDSDDQATKDSENSKSDVSKIKTTSSEDATDNDANDENTIEDKDEKEESKLDKNNKKNNKTLLRSISDIKEIKKKTMSKCSCPTIQVFGIDALRLFKKIWSKQILLNSKKSLVQNLNADETNVENEENDSSQSESVKETDLASDSTDYNNTRFTAVCPLCGERNDDISRNLLKALAHSLDLNESPIRIRINDSDTTVCVVMHRVERKSSQTFVNSVQENQSNLHESGVSNNSTPQSMLVESNAKWVGAPLDNKGTSILNIRNVNFHFENRQNRFYENKLPRDPPSAPMTQYKVKAMDKNGHESTSTFSEKGKSIYSYQNFNSFMVHVLGPLMVPLSVWKNQASSISSKIFKKNRSKPVKKTRKYYTGSNYYRNRVRNHISDKRRYRNGTDSNFNLTNRDTLELLNNSWESMNLAATTTDSIQDEINSDTIDNNQVHKNETSQSFDWDQRGTEQSNSLVSSADLSKVMFSHSRKVLVHCSNCEKSFIVHFDQIKINYC